MRLKNNNEEVIKRLTRKILFTNRTRNIIALIAIILTTYMITTVFSICVSFVKNYNTLWLRVQGTTASISLPNPSTEQIDLLKKENFKSVGYEIYAGSLISPELTKKNTSITLIYSDKTNFYKQQIPAYSDVTGHYPKVENEIMASYRSLEKLGITHPKLGMEINLKYKNRFGEFTDTFKLTGIYKDYTASSSVIYVSEAFINKSGLSLEQDGSAIMAVSNFNRDAVTKHLTTDFPLKENQEFSFSYDLTSQNTSTAIIAAVVIIIISLFIVFSGYLLIYNVLYISVTKDIHFYGLLKTIGTSPKQLRKIVRGQAAYLAKIGIPAGILLATATSFVIIPLALSSLGVNSYGNISMPVKIYFHPVIYIGAILFALLAVLMSCKKPASIAAKISPVEAIRFTGIKVKSKLKNNRNTTKSGKLHRMAFFNVFRDKKRAILVFTSLFLGITTYLCVFAMLDSLKVENFIKTYYPNDFKLTNLPPISQKFDNSFIDKIRSTPGVKNMHIQYITGIEADYNEEIFLPFINLELNSTSSNIDQDEKNTIINKFINDSEVRSNWILSTPTDLIKELNKELKNPIDIEAYERGEIIVLSSFYITKLNHPDFSSLTGKKLTITDENSRLRKTYTIGAVVPMQKMNTYISGQNFGMPGMHVSEIEILNLNKDAIIYDITFDAAPEHEGEIKAMLKSMLLTKDAVDLEAKSDMEVDFSSSIKTMNIMGTGISLLLILIGIINFINIMITGINSRLKEFAVLESIGMTKKQILRMITMEGLYYSIITSILILTIGVWFAYMVAQGMQSIADYAVFSFPVRQLCFILALIFIICLIVPCIVYRSSARATVTERLRMNEV